MQWVYISYKFLMGVLMSIEIIKEILEKHGRLTTPISDLNEESDLYFAGLTSLATVGLMLAIEEEFDIEFPDSMLGRKTFGSIENIMDALEELQ
ncbi:Acyl carrier protein [hydrothermal vent metagenome]|uniref:Acyl carrier protein n=1 Tax=hydrothermal vent metagenome TaxID=652676 RepID=A0A3B0X017_9ZZZZ